ncbi:hypothetical protein DV736_g1638, partial [Chaetothyriales sp. CBS 134916]
MGDCSTDVTLNKTMDVVKTCISNYNSETIGGSLLLEVQSCGPSDSDSSIDTTRRSRMLHGGSLVATYLLADVGELDYHSDLNYTPTVAESKDQIKALDTAVLQKLREAIRSEVDCQVCYAVMLEPLTTSSVQGEPSNKKISRLVEGLLPDLLAARIAAVQLEDTIDEDVNVPLFPLDNGTRKFGMIMYNMHRQPQGDLGQIDFMQYGTLVHIERIEMLADGRFMLETRGSSRFRVMETSVLDGYSIGRIQRIDDMPIAEEEAIEARETGSMHLSEENSVAQIEHMSTLRLLEYCLEFVARSRARSVPWLHQRILVTYGEPPRDPALFPYWFAW